MLTVCKKVNKLSHIVQIVYIHFIYQNTAFAHSNPGLDQSIPTYHFSLKFNCHLVVGHKTTRIGEYKELDKQIILRPPELFGYYTGC